MIRVANCRNARQVAYMITHALRDRPPEPEGIWLIRGIVLGLAVGTFLAWWGWG
jgi:hypothetical protein